MRAITLVAVLLPVTLLAQPVRLEPNDPVKNGVFGHAVDVDRSGLRALIGSPAANVRTDVEDFGGAAYLFSDEHGEWTQMSKLVPAEIGRNDAFGTSVSLSGDGRFAVVGAPLTSGPGYATGAAYVFACDQSGCAEMARLEAPDPHPGDLFGISTATDDSGSLVVVGASGYGFYSGAAWVFERSGSEFALTAELSAEVNQDYAAFGHSVAISSRGDLIWIGEPLSADVEGGRGSVHVFERSGSDWRETANLHPDDFSSSRMFGFSVDLAADSAAGVVGAPGPDGGEFRSGTVSVFSRTSEGWIEQAVFDTSTHPESAWFGRSVSIDAYGSFVLVGAPGDDRNGYTAGRAFVFAKWRDQWSLARELEPDTIRVDDRFGSALALNQSADRAIVGARENSVNEFDAGTAFAFGADLLPVANEPDLPGTLSDRHGGGTRIEAGIFPNPVAARARVHFESPEAQRMRVTVADVTGRLVATLYDGWAQTGSNDVDWNPGGLAPGLYVIQIRGDASAANIPIIVSR